MKNFLICVYRELFFFLFILLIGIRGYMVPFWIMTPIIVLADAPDSFPDLFRKQLFGLIWLASTLIFYIIYFSIVKWLIVKLKQLPKTQNPQ